VLGRGAVTSVLENTVQEVYLTIDVNLLVSEAISLVLHEMAVSRIDHYPFDLEDQQVWQLPEALSVRGVAGRDRGTYRRRELAEESVRRIALRLEAEAEQPRDPCVALRRLEDSVEQRCHEFAYVALDQPIDCEEIDEAPNWRNSERRLVGDALQDIEQDREQFVIWKSCMRPLQLIGERLKSQK
jgi:hypothetical protein